MFELLVILYYKKREQGAICIGLSPFKALPLRRNIGLKVRGSIVPCSQLLNF